MKSIFDSVSKETSKLVIKRYSTSFYFSSSLLSKKIRQDIFNIYGFVRLADEIVDTFHDYPKKQLLDDFESELWRSIDNKISLNPILNSFQFTVNKYSIPKNLIVSFLDSMKMDLDKKEYNSVEEYKKYIYGSADVVGLMCLKVFVNGSDELYRDLSEYAISLGSAFQKVNFLRDLKDDSNILKRVYFPNIDMDRFDENSKIFYLSEMLTYTSRNFHLASQVAYLEANDVINKVIKDNNVESEEVEPLLKLSLLNYYAAAFMMPYNDFLKSAKLHKYDVEILMHHYACSFEQVTHRLTNLQRPGNEGVPFHFLKTDIAGNVSKRFSLSGIHIPRHGGSCPRWNVYTAFLNPGKIHPQISKMPDGRVYFCIARAFEKGIEKHGMPKSFVSIGLGCDMKYAKDLIYSEGIDLNNKKLQMPIGVSCRICPRVECQQRAFPPIDKELKLDIKYRGTSPYVTI